MEGACGSGLSRRSLSVKSRYELSWSAKLITTKTNVQYSPDEIASLTIRTPCRSVFDQSCSTQNHKKNKFGCGSCKSSCSKPFIGRYPHQNTCCDSKKVGLRCQAPSLSVPCPCRTRPRTPAPAHRKVHRPVVVPRMNRRHPSAVCLKPRTPSIPYPVQGVRLQ